jgi:hypothetical protein
VAATRQEEIAMRRIALVLLALVCGCATARAPRHDATAGRVVGRLVLYRDGRPVALTRSGSPLDSTLYGDAALTSLAVHNLDSGEHFTVPIVDERGWFSVPLPAGAYAIGVGHYIWLFDTPARFQAPGAGGRCYLGTLNVSLFSGTSTLGGWARLTGGAVPETDNRFQVLDQPGAAQHWAGQALASCPMQLVVRPAVATR